MNKTQRQKRLREINKSLIGEDKVTEEDISLLKANNDKEKIKVSFLDGIKGVWWANEGYEPWMLKKKFIGHTVSSSGCHSDSCGEGWGWLDHVDLGCICNDFNLVERKLLRQGYYKMAFIDRKGYFIWSNGKSVVRDFRSFGR